MAVLNGLNILKNSNFYIQQRAIANIRTMDNLTNIHIKLNVPTLDGSMWMIEAVGYNYGSQQSIRGAWCWYSYPDSGIGWVGLQTVYPGLTPAGVYSSTDGYVVLRGTFVSSYFTGFVLNGYSSRDGLVNEASVLGYTFISSAANQY